ncbi:hypothetical protein MATL_G00192470 [Megalops atlanticus]|uniref:Serine/threonine-protein kinase 1 n=1 Tax=Megalops atlanticus TaxID=7932 RepID=A0A9D3PMS7_MEGAT|nr:hypothetical protein MATL_G00192470 [Megalops atlanticus]
MPVVSICSPLYLLQVIMRQLVEAIQEVHRRGVVHRDLKPENILIESGSGGLHVHVVDFGCGSMLRERPYRKFQGTSAYTPPEWYQQNEFHAEASTVWQLGVVLYQMLSGNLPFSSTWEICHMQLDVCMEPSSDCQDLLHRCLDKKPQARPTLQDMLQHPWLQ